MFVGRRADTSIYGLWTVRQFVGQEELPDNSPDVLAFLTPTAAQVVDASRLAAIDSTIASFVFGGATITQLKAMDNAAFNAWWTANVTTLAQANAVLQLLARTMLRRVL